MKTITFRQTNAFNGAFHQKVTQTRLTSACRDLNSLRSSFRLREYGVTANYQFHIGWGAAEPAHTDLSAYQALLIVEPNGWVLKNPRDSYKSTFQDKGDLIILDTGLLHEIIWDRSYRKPIHPWLYIFIDAYRRGRWSKANINRHQASQLALQAVQELDNPVYLKWLAANDLVAGKDFELSAIAKDL